MNGISNFLTTNDNFLDGDGSTDERKDENYIPLGINAEGYKNTLGTFDLNNLDKSQHLEGRQGRYCSN